MKDTLSALATNLHIVVISLLIVGLDLGVVRVSSSRTSHRPPSSITLTTNAGSQTPPQKPQHSTAGGTLLPGGTPATSWHPPAIRSPYR
jgi:hypothetical protein